MAAEDWLPEEFDDDAWYVMASPFETTCKFCKFCLRTGFQWDRIWDDDMGKFRFFLVDGRNRVHNCRVASASDFEDLTNVPNITPTSSAPTERRPVSRPGNSAEARKRSKPSVHKISARR